jgi:hypothetical protein
MRHLSSDEEMLMNVEVVKRPIMEYRDQEFRYESDSEEFQADLVRQQTSGKEYRAKRSSRDSRRRSPKASHPGHGISGRRNRRWAW